MMRRRPILYVTAAGTLVFSVLAIILGLRGIIVSLEGSSSRTWTSFGCTAATCGLICLGFHIRLRRPQRNGDSSRRGRKC